MSDQQRTSTVVRDGASAPDPTRPPTPRELLRRLRMRVLHGDRPYIVAFLAATGFSLVIVSGPIQTWMTQRDLVEQRAGVLAVLAEENERLAERLEELNDPATIERQAREDQGMIYPGEVPIVIVPPDADRERIAADLTDVDADERGWFARVWEAITGLVD